MTEKVACHNCTAACCKGSPPIIMSLSAQEHSLMQNAGNSLLTIAEPAGFDREKVIYPTGMITDLIEKRIGWIVEPGNEYEPLPAWMGRYALLGDCRNLVKDESGLESCGVYNERPQVCRDFQMGSAKCLLLRQVHGVQLPMAQ